VSNGTLFVSDHVIAISGYTYVYLASTVKWLENNCEKNKKTGNAV